MSGRMRRMYMEVIAHYRIATNIDPEYGCEHLQTPANPALAVIEVFP